MSSAPTLLAHVDWSMHPKKRWMAVAQLEGDTYMLSAPEPVGETASLLSRLRSRALGEQFVVGFDFPIGVPIVYAERTGITSFLAELPRFGTGRWAKFYEPAQSACDISPWRPFYPYRAFRGASHQQLFDGLGVQSMHELLRVCDRGGDRGNACSLFWTLGANQVGKGAISGWREVLVPALAQSTMRVAIWPFHGDLYALLQTSECVLLETYPAEACLHIGLGHPGVGWSKVRQSDRQRKGERLLGWAVDRPRVSVLAELESDIRNGFSPDANGEDRFDAVVGLMSMLEVILGHRTDGVAGSPAHLHVEGWILGQHSEE